MIHAARHVGRTATSFGGLVRTGGHQPPFAARFKHYGRSRIPPPRPDKSADSKAEYRDEAAKLFSPENLQGLSQLEIARMKVAYGLVKEHAEVMEKGQASPNPEVNPLIDPRSFGVRSLPRLPREVLAAFRKELPARDARAARPVQTGGLWGGGRGGPGGGGGGGSGSGGGMSEDAVGRDAAEWAAVDERTMDARQFARMRRQSINAADAMPFPARPAAPAAGAAAAPRARRRCPLSDARGRVAVDFRAVAKIASFVSVGGKIAPRRKSGLSAKAQRRMSRAVKSARQMALLAPDPPAGLTLAEMQEMDATL